jgi:hypothetical protein
MVARLMVLWCASLTMVAARSSRLQRVAGRSCASVLLVARLTTARSSSGGKAPGSAGAGCVLKALEAVGGEALSPLADGMAVAAQFVGDLLIGRPVVAGGVEDEAAAKGHGLGRGPGADEGSELLALVRGENDA